MSGACLLLAVLARVGLLADPGQPALPDRLEQPASLQTEASPSVAEVERALPELRRLHDAAAWKGLEVTARSLLAFTVTRAGENGTSSVVARHWLIVALAGQRQRAAAATMIRANLPGLRRNYAAQDPDLADLLAAYSDILRDGADLVGAGALSGEALKIREANQARDPFSLAVALNDLAVIRHQEGRRVDAVELYRRALRVLEPIRAADDPAIAAVHRGLAAVLLDLRQVDEAERQIRRAIASQTAAGGALDHDATSALATLGGVLAVKRDLPGASAAYERALAADRAASPTRPLQVARDLVGLAGVAKEQGRITAAMARLEEALALYRRAGELGVGYIVGLEQYALALLELGRNQEAKAEAAKAAELARVGPDPWIHAFALNVLGTVHWRTADYAGAERVLRDALRIREQTLGSRSPLTGESLNNLAQVVAEQGRLDEAIPLTRRSLALAEAATTPSPYLVAQAHSNLAGMLARSGRASEAEGEYRLALAIVRAVKERPHVIAIAVNNLAVLLEGQRRLGEAETLYREALALDLAELGERHAATAVDLNNLGSLLNERHRFAEARQLAERALTTRIAVLGPNHPETLESRSNVAAVDAALGDAAAAIAGYRIACRGLRNRARPLSADPRALAHVQEVSARCASALATSLWDLASKASSAVATGLGEEAFEWSQEAVRSPAADALSLASARAAATARQVAPESERYEALLLRRERLDQEYAGLVGAQDAAGAARLQADRSSVDDGISVLEAALKARAPTYWQFRTPLPLAMDALRAATPIRSGDALVSFIMPSGDERGLVFAVSRDRFAWARLRWTTRQVGEAVAKLRTQIDPGGYSTNLRGVGGGQRGALRDPIRIPAPEGAPEGFDPQLAHQLHDALLGDPAVAAVIAPARTLLVVPAGPLTSFPFGLLVTRPSRAVTSVEDYRRVPWLLRDKSIAALPSVSTLPMLDAGTRPPARSGERSLLVLANPDFAGSRSGATPRVAWLVDLPTLPGTQREAEALQTLYSATQDDVLTGASASVAQLLTRNRHGALRSLEVLALATHGLVAGSFPGLTEPALAMAAPLAGASDDGLLRASDAASLRLGRTWVVLSACNTASPDADAPGVSGLARAFFYADARGVLVSHWRLRDDVAALLVPDVLRRMRESPGLTAADALRLASLAVLDGDPRYRGPDLSNPAAWAALTLIGL